MTKALSIVNRITVRVGSVSQLDSVTKLRGDRRHENLSITNNYPSRIEGRKGREFLFPVMVSENRKIFEKAAIK